MEKRDIITLKAFFEMYANGEIEITKCETTYSDDTKECIEIGAVVMHPIDRAMIDVSLKV